jgi:ribosomal protein S18 acetylase RimI-like enzyme
MAQGSFRPGRWWLAWHGDQPAGVLLLSEMAEWRSLDVAYVGVVPETRGRGWGRELMLGALNEARTANVAFVTLAVDARHRPARALYDRLGFEVFEERGVYLYFYGGAEYRVLSSD